MNKRVRLVDVAEASKTSIKTVSRVLNNDERVSDETRERVQKIMNDLGYQVDIIARSLRTGVDKVIGVVIPKIGDPFFAELVEEIAEFAIERGISVIVGSTHGRLERENELVQGFIQRRVMGMIIAPQELDYAFLKKVSIPTVFIDRAPNKFKGDLVRVDDEFGGKLATNHLIKFGHKRIAYFADSLKIRTAELRYKGFKEALEEAKLKLDKEIIFVNLDPAENLDATIAKILNLKNPPTAIFSPKAEFSISIVSALHKIKRTDIALISFDDFTLASSIQPSITVLDHSAREIGRESVRRLFEKINGSEDKPKEYIIGLNVIERGSGELRAKVKL